MVLKGFFTVVLGRCGVMSKEEKECQRSIDNSNAHYSKTFKSDRAHSEAAEEIKREKHHVQDVKPQEVMAEEPVQMFKEVQSSRENTLVPRKRRQLSKANCERYACGRLGGKSNHDQR